MGWLKMIVEVLGSGPEKITEGEGRNHRLPSMLLVDGKILIGAGPCIDQQLNGLSADLRAVFLSDAKDISGIAKSVKYSSLDKLPVYLSKENVGLLGEYMRTTSCSGIELNEAHESKQFNLLGYGITPIKTGDSSVAWRIGDIVYAGNVDQDFFESKNSEILLGHILDSRLTFLDGNICNGRVKGHLNLWDAARKLKKLKAKNVFFFQMGNGSPDHDELTRLVKRYDRSFSIAHDDMRIDTSDLRFALTESREGISLPREQAQMVWSGNKKLIIKKKKYDSSIGRCYYLVGGNDCFGIIRIKSISPIDAKEFKERELEHRISEQARKEQWPNSEVLFAYDFDLVEKYPEPRQVKLGEGSQEFVSDVQFLMQQEELIKDARNYSPEKLPTDVLQDDFRIALAWYSSKKSGKDMEYSIEEILNLVRIIADELKKRGVVFHPDKMTPNAKEAFDRSINELREMSHVPGYLDRLENAILIKDFISLVGSTVEKGKGNDIDLLVRSSDLPDFLKRAIQTRISKMVPEKADEFHLIVGDAEGPHDEYVPLYDLAIIRCEPNPVSMSLSEFSPLHPFAPMKPKERFYRPEDAAKYAFGKAGKWAIEKKYDGFRAVIHKKGTEVKIFSDQSKDITNAFPTAKSQALKLSGEDLIIDCELVPYRGNMPLGRSEAAKYIGSLESGKQIDDKEVRFYAFDLLYLGKPLIAVPWSERQQLLRRLEFQHNIRKCEGLVVDSFESSVKAMNFMKRLAGSEGAMLKDYNGNYEPGKETDDWIKFRKELELRLQVLKVNQVGGTANVVNYSVGVPVSGEKDIDPSRILDGKLVLGNTFNTTLKADVGAILLVNVEEVWRHEKGAAVHYSIHKPKVREIISEEPTTISELDKMVVSRGVAQTLSEEELEKVSEGREHEVQNFSNEMQESFREIVEKEEPKSFVMQWHYRGHALKDGGNYKYKMDSLHCDLRMQIWKDYLEGFTLLSPTSSDESVPNLIGPEMKHVRAVLKMIQPTGWLTHEGINEPSEAGSTSGAPSVMVIVGKGKYMPIEVDDHKIEFRFECESGQVNGSVYEQADKAGILIERKLDSYMHLPQCTSFHIAHIEANKWILLADGVKCSDAKK
jgi:ATP-dependent DNA ligase